MEQNIGSLQVQVLHAQVVDKVKCTKCSGMISSTFDEEGNLIMAACIDCGRDIT